MCGCGDYPPTFYEQRSVKGRKEHRCDECLRVIKTGERHQYAKGLWDGDFLTFRTCETCIGVIKDAEVDCYCHGHLMDDLDARDFFGMKSVEDFFIRRRANYDAIELERRRQPNDT